MTLPSWQQSYIVWLERLLNLAAWVTEGKRKMGSSAHSRGILPPRPGLKGDRWRGEKRAWFVTAALVVKWGTRYSGEFE